MREQTVKPVASMHPSDEANREQLELAKRQGDAYQNALDHMTKQEAQGAEQRAGDYRIGYAEPVEVEFKSVRITTGQKKS